MFDIKKRAPSLYMNAINTVCAVCRCCIKDDPADDLRNLPLPHKEHVEPDLPTS